jgi:hypothetical protein
MRDVLLLRHNTIWVPDTVAERMQMTAEAEMLADAVGDPVGRFWSALYRYCPVTQVGDLAELTRCSDRYRSLATEVGQPTLLWMSAWFDTIHAQLVGDIDRAEALAALAFQLGTDSGQPDALLIYAGAVNSIRTHQGRDAELVDGLAAMVATNPGLPFVRAALARTYVDIGRENEARQLLVAETAVAFPLPTDPALLSGLVLWAEVAARVGERAAAEQLYERLSSWPDQVVFNGNIIYGPVSHYLGQLATALGRFDSADSHFKMSQAVHDRLRSPYHQARTHLEWGRMLRDRCGPGDADHARSHLEAARDLASRYGCTLVEQRASELLSDWR